jgi:predicted transcriptional regulator
MAALTIELEISPEVYERAKQIAEQSQRSVALVLQESLTLLFGDWQATQIQPAELRHYSDEQLWAIVHRHLAWPNETRLRALAAQGKRERLSEAEYTEMERLVGQVDRYMLLRTHALILLKERGHQVEQQLNLGA